MTTTSPTAVGAAFRFDRRAWTALLVLCTAVLFEGMSLSAINVQLAGIRAGLSLGPDRLQLVAGAFLVAYAGLLLAGGTAADRWGGRRVFLAGVAVFGAGSLGAALAQGAFSLVAARAVQGAGAAITAPAAVSLIVASFPEGSPRNRALGVFSAMGAVGFSLGVVTGGLLTAGFGWRGGFVLYVPLTLLVLVVGGRVLKPSAAPAAARRPLPYGSALLVTGGLAALVHGVGRVGSASFAEVGAVAGTGLLAVLAFLAVQRRAASPLLPLGLVTDRRMAAACVALGGAFAGITGAMFLVATDLQDRQGLSALAAGLAFLPQGIAVGVLSTPAARLADRRPPTLLLLSGLAVITAGQLLYTTVWSGAYVTHLLPAALLVGAGIAVAYPAAVMLAGVAATRENQGTASGTLVTCQQAGGALGVAVVTGIQSTTPGVFWTGPYGLWACFGFAALALVTCAALLARRGGRTEASQ
ncbi:MFS transporter [Streptomyces sp. NPDC127092]|uniref:MFS transporter n=1 Tax=Streptomyces sp. NPDC127092 TaxID=3347135 RepID=UPI0036607BA9